MSERATVKRYHKDGFFTYNLRNFYIDPTSDEEIEWGALPETFVDAADYEDLRSTYEAELLETEKDRNYWRSECLSKSQEADQAKRKLTLALQAFSDQEREYSEYKQLMKPVERSG